jgi:hypothetical protein
VGSSDFTSLLNALLYFRFLYIVTYVVNTWKAMLNMCAFQFFLLLYYTYDAPIPILVNIAPLTFSILMTFLWTSCIASICMQWHKVIGQEQRCLLQSKCLFSLIVLIIHTSLAYYKLYSNQNGHNQASKRGLQSYFCPS